MPAAASSSHLAARAALLGHAVGDALGVPVEFNARRHLDRHPVTGMTGPGTHNQPPGTWSDDHAMTLCTAEVLLDGFDAHRLMAAFDRWLMHQHWTPHGEVFDVGNATRDAILSSVRFADPRDAGGRGERHNGNGALMRMLPVALAFAHADPAARHAAVDDAGRLTHAHVRSRLACRLYADLVAGLLRGDPLAEGWAHARTANAPAIAAAGPEEQKVFARLLDPGLTDLPRKAISGSGYVIHTLEAAVWCVTRYSTLPDAVLAAVNLGEDTDTTAAVTGSLAGLIHGPAAIPAEWTHALARRAEILDLHHRFVATLPA